MAAKAEDPLAPVVKRLALLFALSVTTLLPAGYFGVKYLGMIDHVETTARVKADAVSSLVARNPDMWTYQLQRIESFLPQYPVQLEQERVTVRNLAGDALVTLGDAPAAPALRRAASIRDSGRAVGQVEIVHSYRGVLIGTLIATLLGLLLGLAVYTTLVILPLRALHRVTAALWREKEALAKSEARFRSLTELSSDWYWEQDDQFRFIDASGGLRERLGNNEYLGKTRWELPIVGVSAERWAGHRADLEAHRPFRNFEYALRARDDRLMHLLTSGVPVFDESGKFKGYRGAGTDITERKEREESLRRFRAAIDATEDAIYLVDRESMRYIDVNASACEALGLEREQILALGPEGVLSMPREELARIYDSVIAGGEAVKPVEMLRTRADGKQVWVELRRQARQSETGWTIITVARDITRRKAAEDEIKNLAYYDPLTQLPNRRLLMDRLQHALASSDRSRRRGALLFIDLDHFKTLNDTLGHDKGDLLLQQVARRLSACVRASDTVARLGGDEFVVMLERLSERADEAAAQARTVAKKILATFNQAYVLAGHPYQSSGSIGIAPFCGRDQSENLLLKQADTAMYQAKAAGRNALHFFDAKIEEVAAAAMARARHAPGAPEQAAPSGADALKR